MKITLEKSLWQALNSNFSKSELDLYNHLLDLGLFKASFMISKKKLALSIGKSTETVKRHLKKFALLGLITKRQYDIFSVNIIAINQYVYSFASCFKNKFPSLFKYLFFVYVKPNVPPYKDKKEYINNIIANPLRLERIILNITNKIMKKIKYKTNYTLPAQLLITPTLKEIIKELKLNEVGRLKLLIFPDNILQEQWNIIKTTIKAPLSSTFNKLFNNSVIYCKNRQIPIEWNLYYSGMKALNLNDNGKYCFDDNEIEYMNTMIHIYGDSYKPPIKLVDPNETFLKFGESLSNYIQVPEHKKQEQHTDLISLTNIDRPHADKKEAHPLFAEFTAKFMENL